MTERKEQFQHFWPFLSAEEFVSLIFFSLPEDVAFAKNCDLLYFIGSEEAGSKVQKNWKPCQASNLFFLSPIFSSQNSSKKKLAIDAKA